MKLLNQIKKRWFNQVIRTLSIVPLRTHLLKMKCALKFKDLLPWVLNGYKSLKISILPKKKVCTDFLYTAILKMILSSNQVSFSINSLRFSWRLKFKSLKLSTLLQCFGHHILMISALISILK